MAFLNKKEDVIDFQLTQYGKYLVSQGRFKPVYYAFYDDDIIYDQRYVTGSGLEEQKDIENRILENTPSLDAQYLFHSVDNLGMQDQFSRSNDAAERANWDWHQAHRNKLQQIPEKHYVLTSPLATSDLTSDKAPSFDIFFKEGNIKNVELVISGSDDESLPIQKIPQIYLEDVKFLVSVRNVAEEPAGTSTVFSDGTYFHVKRNQVLFRVTEENTLLEQDEFDVEAYVLDENNKIQHPLHFQKKPEMVRDGILLDDPARHLGLHGEPQVDDVEYFFDIFIDGDVDEATE